MAMPRLIVVELLYIHHQLRTHHAEVTFMMTTHHHNHLDMGIAALAAEDHTGIPGNHLIHQPIHLRIGEGVDGINPILRLRLHIQILCMGLLRIMVLHLTIHTLLHHRIMAHPMITIQLCMVETPNPIQLTTIEEVLLRPCQGLITQ